MRLRPDGEGVQIGVHPIDALGGATAAGAGDRPGVLARQAAFAGRRDRVARWLGGDGGSAGEGQQGQREQERRAHATDAGTARCSEGTRHVALLLGREPGDLPPKASARSTRRDLGSSLDERPRRDYTPRVQRHHWRGGRSAASQREGVGQMPLDVAAALPGSRGQDVEPATIEHESAQRASLLSLDLRVHRRSSGYGGRRG